MAVNFPNMGKEIVPKKMYPKRSTPRHIMINKAKDRERISKATRGILCIIFKGNPIRLSTDFSAETLQAIREQNDIFKVLKGKKSYNQEYSAQQGYHSELKAR